MIAASFESYGEPLTIQYQFTEDEQEIRNTTNTRSSIVHQVQTLEPATPQETFKPVHSDIKSQYTFANFVQGDNNHWAKAAALAVSDNLGELYNPLFIFGGPGLGKTHILNAIGNKVLADNPQARIKYVSSETFINEFLEHLRLNDMESFKNLSQSGLTSN